MRGCGHWGHASAAHYARSGNTCAVTQRPSDHSAIERQRPLPHTALAPAILFENDEVLCLAKPAGLATQPGKGHLRDTLLNGAFALRGEALSTLGADCDWGLLHRLDRDVSGVVLLAKNVAGYQRLRLAFAQREIEKRYLAVVQGKPPSAHGMCSRPIREERRGEVKIATCPLRGGEVAQTRWTTLAREATYSVLEVELITGRLHQIRVHMAALGCPIMGDRMYRADAPPNTSRLPKGRVAEPLLLHAWKIGFAPAATKPLLWVSCPLPPSMCAYWSDGR